MNEMRQQQTQLTKARASGSLSCWVSQRRQAVERPARRAPASVNAVPRPPCSSRPVRTSVGDARKNKGEAEPTSFASSLRQRFDPPHRVSRQLILLFRTDKIHAFSSEPCTILCFGWTNLETAVKAKPSPGSDPLAMGVGVGGTPARHRQCTW